MDPLKLSDVIKHTYKYLDDGTRNSLNELVSLNPINLLTKKKQDFVKDKLFNDDVEYSVLHVLTTLAAMINEDYELARINIIVNNYYNNISEVLDNHELSNLKPLFKEDKINLDNITTIIAYLAIFNIRF